MAAWTFSVVSGRTFGLPCSTRETVDLDTPAARATSMIVVLRMNPAIRLGRSVAKDRTGT